jgi:hypothetical protein
MQMQERIEKLLATVEGSSFVATLEAEAEERRNAERKAAVAELERICSERAKTTPITAGPMLLAEDELAEADKALGAAIHKYWRAKTDHEDSEYGFVVREDACRKRMAAVVPEWFTDASYLLSKLVQAVKAEQKDGERREWTIAGALNVVQTNNLAEVQPIIDDVSAIYERLKLRPFEAITDAELKRYAREALEAAKAKAMKIIPSHKLVGILGPLEATLALSLAADNSERRKRTA